MREIKFRAQDFTGTWQYGFVVKGNETAIIIPVNKNGSVAMSINFYVKPETVGQYTGLKDKNGKEIYEGDVVLAYGFRGHYRIHYQCGIWILIDADGNWIGFTEEFDGIGVRCDIKDVEVIGNIHDNPELLKE